MLGLLLVAFLLLIPAAGVAAPKKKPAPRKACAAATLKKKATRKKKARLKAAGCPVAQKKPARTSSPPAITCCDGPAPAATPPAAPPPGPGPLIVGLNVNAQAWGDGAWEPLDRSAFLGTTWVREELEWSGVEAVKGRYDWTRYDQLLTATAQRGRRVLLMPTSPPAWAAPTETTLPNDPAEYGRFVAQAVRRYGPSGTFWTAHPSLPKVPVTAIELWNEPYEPYFSQGGLDPAKYAAMVRAAATAGRAADPAVQYLLGATPYAKGLDRPWTDALYAAMPDLNAFFDAVAVHPYGRDLTDPDGQWRRTFEDVRAALDAHGGAAKPLWATEMGWSTCRASSECVGEEGQAVLLSTALETIRTRYRGSVAAVFPFHFQDQFGAHPASDPEAFYGLVRNDWTPKPAAAVLAAFTASP